MELGRLAMLGVVCLGVLGAPGHVSAQTFREDFNGSSLDAAVWQVASGDGQVVVADGFATLSCAGFTLPVVTTTHDSFPAGDFAIQVVSALRMADSCAPRPTAFFFGHPHPVGCGGWTSVALDFVEITDLEATPTQANSWGGVKLIYR